ncbi:MAG: LPP20 family lipoprotein [Muribaculaceae bacterium]|nr:LPP20 family lipoprotein [Muribaculaceae bacterium]
MVNSPQYLYGEGWGVTVAEADKQALNDLISKITVNVEGTTTITENERNINGNIDATTNFGSIVKTYSQATLNNTEKVILENEPEAHVGRWIKRSEINKLFELRKLKIKDYVQSAVNAERAGKIDVALKDYYWALSLLQSLQYPDGMTFQTEEGDEVVLMTWIPRQMNEIFSNLDSSYVKKNGDDIEIFITYKGLPVNSIDYTYFDGSDWGNIYSAKDGVGIVEMASGNQNENYQLKYEYEYKGEAHIDKDVEAVLESIKTIPMRNAYQSFKKNDDIRMNSHSKNSNSFSKLSQEKISKPKEFQASSETKDVIDKIIKSIVEKNYDNVKSYFTPYGYDIYERLLKYGKAKVVGTPDVKFYEDNGTVYARGLQLSFSFASGMRKSFVEDIVFTFNKEGLIDNLSFGLGKTAEDDILGKGFWDEKARFAIMNFLENYQTAYALKRLDYIETIFDDNAVIITGAVVYRQNQPLNGEINGIQFGGDIIKYNRHTKDSYLKALKRSFEGKEYINLRFADNEVRKLGKGGEVYAIQISQEYYSSNYGDKGYLFLMVDINDPANPIIKVRTWQPEKDPDFGVYGPEDFM